MKYLLVLLFFATLLSSAKAQEGCVISNPTDSVRYIASGIWYWPILKLKESAKENYFVVMDMINNKVAYTKEGFDTALDKYEYFRKAVDLKLSSKKDRDDFHNWIVAQARAAGKITYKEDKTPKP